MISLEPQGPGSAWNTGHSLNICVKKEGKEGRKRGRKGGGERKKSKEKKQLTRNVTRGKILYNDSVPQHTGLLVICSYIENGDNNSTYLNCYLITQIVVLNILSYFMSDERGHCPGPHAFAALWLCPSPEYEVTMGLPCPEAPVHSQCGPLLMAHPGLALKCVHL